MTKLKFLLLLFAGIFATTLGFFMSYSNVTENGNTTEEYTTEEDVCYYGCPNSKRVKKLVTRKKRLAR